jgi:anion-transporting  ArsA/GET3 family ATPase
MTALLDKRLLFVMGKGGVGKSTVAAALGLLAARRGKRTIVCELAQQQRMSRIFAREGVGPEETELGPKLSAISIDPQRALEEYLRFQVGSRALSRLLFDNRIFQYLVAAAPGARELVTMGKVWELAQLERPWTEAPDRYELVVVDAPATGHGLGVLQAPRTIRDVARVGTIRRQANRIDTFVRDAEKTGTVAVTLPEEMAVTETMELRERMAEQVGIRLDALVANAVHPERFTPEEADGLAALASADGRVDDERVRLALRAALFEHRSAVAQREQLRRLTEDSLPVCELPFMPEPELGHEQVEELSLALERELERGR